MARIERYTKEILEPREVANTVDPSAISSAAAPYEAAADAANFANNLIQKEKEAQDATKLSEQYFAFRKDELKTRNTLELENQSTPEGFSAVYEEAADDLLNSYADTFTDAKVRSKFLEVGREITLSGYNSALTYQRTQGAKVGVDRINNSLQDEYDIVSETGDVDQSLENVLIAVDAASTIVGDEVKLKALRVGGQEAVVKSAVSGALDRLDFDSASEILEKHKDKMSSEDYMQTRDVIVSRVKFINDTKVDREVINNIRGGRSLINKSASEGMTLAEIDQAAEEQGISKSTKNLLLKINGYKTTQGLTDRQKTEGRAQIMSAVVGMEQEGKVSPEMLESFSDQVYEAIEHDVFSREEGVALLDRTVSQAVEDRQDELKRYKAGSFFSFNSAGYNQVENFLKEYLPKAKGDEKDAIESINAVDKVKLYDYYSDALEEEVASNPQINSMEDMRGLSNSNRKKVFSSAVNKAKYRFLVEKYPNLSNRTIDNFESQVITSFGKVVQTGLGDGAAVASVDAPDAEVVKIQSDDDYNALPSGARFVAPDGTTRIKP